MRRSGIGDAISNLSAIADWQLAERERGEPVDGLAVTFARTAATSILHRADGVDDADFLIALAEALVLSGLAMATAGSQPPVQRRRPRDPPRHRPALPRHGAPRRAGRRGEPVLRGAARRRRRWRPTSTPACAATGCRARPAELGLGEEQFAAAVLHAPATRPDRYTVLEHLGLGEQEVAARVREFAAAFA